ncbi:methyl-accepting chemotaxis protein, partial [Patescibacteria group bacterium]|nr:methyl-accepting chemotaxis protein [Patescibacteria group bacterium]
MEGLEQQHEENEALRYELEEISEANEKIAGGIGGLNDTAKLIADSTERVSLGIDDLNDTAERIEEISELTLLGVGALNYTANRIAGGIDDLNDTAEGIYDEVSEMNEGIWALNAIQKRQKKLLGKINQSIIKHGEQTNKLLTELAGLAVEHIRETVRTRKMMLSEIKRVTLEAVAQIVFTLRRLEARMAKGLDEVSDSVREVGLIAGEIRDEIKKNTATMISLAENSEAIRASQHRELSASVEKVAFAAKKIRNAVRENTETLVHLAENSLVIKAIQYREQGLAMLKDGHNKQGINRLKKAFALNNLDFDTNIFLANAYRNAVNHKKARQHIGFAESCAGDNNEGLALCKSVLANQENVEGNNDAAAAACIEAIKNYPAIYYLILEINLHDLNVVDKVFVPLITDNEGDPNIPALCAIELIKRGDEANAEKAVTKLLGLLDGTPLDGKIRKKFMVSL